MARTSLREFQESLARRLAGAAAHDSQNARLVVESGGELWLMPLADAGEVMPLPWLTRVPLTQRWYAGLVNVRGALHGMVDLADFYGKGVTPRDSKSAFLLCGQRHGLNAGLLVRRLVGLRGAQDFTIAQDKTPDRPWISAIQRDHDGREYRELNVARLIRDPAFMDISAEVAA
jgi:twitching motility protein PilI